MDRFELVEKLVKSTGVSYEDAKTALESSGWDLLDAAVWLEKNGRIETRTNHFTTDPEQQQQQQAEAAEVQRQQQQREETARRTAAAGNRSGNSNNILHSLFVKLRGILMDNEFVICKQSGEIFLELPVWLIVLLLIVEFLPTVGVMIVVFFLGFRFRLHGPDLGGDMINSILNRAENSASGFVDKVKNQVFNNRNTSYQDRNEDVIDYEDPNKKE